MKKNLKKVISAVLALTLAMSSFVALSATASADETATSAGFPDVESTANYAEAVYALKALGVIVGDENGNFNPDATITRAEVAVMAVAAQNLSEDAKLSSASTKFADVNEKAPWATGYVNVGVNNGFFSGRSETEFAPSENMTYVEVLSMLTRMLNYGDLAVARGGWPDGYIWAASQSGIISGVTAGQNDELTRAQVAQLIWNTIKTPVLASADLAIKVENGTMVKLDGSDNADGVFQTILSSKFDAYYFSGEVTNTSKAAVDGEELELGTVSIKLTGKNDWDAECEDLVKNHETATEKKELVKTMAVGNTDAENNLFAECKAVASYVDGDWELIYFAPSSTTATKTVDGTLVNEDDSVFTGSNMVLAINRSSSSTSNPTKYKLTDEAKLYVNGFEYCDVAGNGDTVIKLLEASTGDAVLYEDTDATGTKYNKIMIDAYTIATVSQVKVSGDDVTIRLTDAIDPLGKTPKTTIKVDADEVEDGNFIISVTKAGAAVDASALEEDDVVAIAYDLNKTLDVATNIEIIATNETFSGQYSSYDSDDEVYTIGGKEYEASAIFSDTLERGTTYTFRVDPFGKLVSSEAETSSKMYAIVERAVDVTDGNSSYEDSYMQVMTLDGQSKRLEIYSNYNTKAFEILDGMGIEDTIKATGKAIAPADRVISYTVRSNGQVNKIEKVDTVAFEGTYNATTGKIDSVRVASDATVLDASDYDQSNANISDYSASSMSALVGTVDYKGFAVHKNTSSNAYTYIVLTSTGAIYGPTSNFVVAAENASADSEDYVNETDVYTLDVIDLTAEGEEVTLYISEEVEVYVGDNDAASFEDADTYIKKGAAFFYTTDSDGYVNRIDVLYNGGKSFDEIVAAGETSLINVFTSKGGDTVASDDWAYGADVTWSTDANNEIQLFFAPVISKSSSSVIFSEIKSDAYGKYIDTEVANDFTVTSESNIYSMDLSATKAKDWEVGAGSFSGIDLSKTTEDGKAYLVDVEGQRNFEGQFQMAFVMVVDGEVVNAIVFND